MVYCYFNSDLFVPIEHLLAVPNDNNVSSQRQCHVMLSKWCDFVFPMYVLSCCSSDDLQYKNVSNNKNTSSLIAECEM